MRPRCFMCRHKSVRGQTYCRKHKQRAEDGDKWWASYMRGLVSEYEKETGQIHLPMSKGWRDWLTANGMCRQETSDLIEEYQQRIELQTLPTGETVWVKKGEQ